MPTTRIVIHIPEVASIAGIGAQYTVDMAETFGTLRYRAFCSAGRTSIEFAETVDVSAASFRSILDAVTAEAVSDVAAEETAR